MTPLDALHAVAVRPPRARSRLVARLAELIPAARLLAGAGAMPLGFVWSQLLPHPAGGAAIVRAWAELEGA